MNRSLLLTLLLAGACAGSRDQTRAASGSDEGGLQKAPPAAVKAAAANGQPDPNEVICTFERETGSNIPEKTCRTRWQIEEERRQAGDWAETHTRSNGGKGGL